MFDVRCFPRPTPQSAVSRPLPCTLRARRDRLPPPASQPAQPAPHRVPCLRPSAGREGLQPATELGHLPRYEDARHVCRALLSAPDPPICSLSPSPLHAACSPRSPASSRLPACTQPASHRVPCSRPSADRESLQPTLELGHLPRDGHDLHVWRALLPTPCPPIRPRSPLPGTLRACRDRPPPPASRPAARPAPRVLCLRPSAARVRLQPAPELGHLERHVHAQYVLRALPPHAPCPPNLQSHLSLCTLHAHRARSPPPAPRPAHSPHRTVCPACDPRQEARAFNQPLSWDTSGVTDMRGMFDVRCSPRPIPAPQPPKEPAVSRPLPCKLRAPRLRPYNRGRRLARRLSLIPRPYTPSLRLGRTQSPCPPPTRCSSVARGRAPPPSPPLAMARTGRREAALETLTEVCVRPRQSL